MRFSFFPNGGIIKAPLQGISQSYGGFSFQKLSQENTLAALQVSSFLTQVNEKNSFHLTFHRYTANPEALVHFNEGFTIDFCWRREYIEFYSSTQIPQ